MFRVIVRRSTLTIRSTIGISRKRPGPFGAGRRRPRRKTMPRSYSRATLIAEIANRSSRNRTTARATRAAFMFPLPAPAKPAPSLLVRLRQAYASYVDPMHVEGQAVQPGDADLVPGPQGLVGAGAPELAADEDLPVAPGDAFHADDLLRTYAHGRTAHRNRLRDRECPEAAEHRRERDDEPKVGVVRSRRVVEQRGEADRDR